MSRTPTDIEPQGGSKSAIFFLFAAFCVMAYASVFGGGPVAQVRGELRSQALLAFVITGLLGTLYFASTRRPFVPRSQACRVAFLLPAYALFQISPLSLPLLRFLSPSRAELNEALRPVIQPLAWVPISVTPSATLYHFLAFSACAVLFLVIFNLSGKVGLSPWTVTLPLMIVAAGQAILGLLQVSANPDGIAMGTYLIRNHYAGLLEMVLPFALVYPFVVRSASAGKSQIITTVLACLSLFVAALIAVALVASLSRAGFFSALISTAFMATVALCNGRSVKGASAVLASVAVATVLAVMLLPSARLVERFSEMKNVDEDRPPAWRDTVQLIKAYPIVGCGLGAYESAFVKFKRSAPALNQDYAHNDYLQYLAELGLIGFALAAIPLAILLARLAAAIRNPNPRIRLLSLACAGSAIAIATHSIVDFNLYVPANMLVFAWILGIAAYLGDWNSRNPRLQAGSSVIVLE